MTFSRSTPVLFVGDAAWSEFREVNRWLAKQADVYPVPDAALAVKAIECGACLPQVILVAQRWPGEFSRRQFDRLRRLAPLARVIELMGSWCEGVQRSEETLPAKLPLAWHQAIARLAPEFDRATEGGLPAWGLPATATDEERLLAAMPALDGRRQAAPRGLLAVHAANSETAAALCAAAAGYGFGAVWLRGRLDEHVAGAAAAIWDVRSRTVANAEGLAEWRAARGDAPIAALVDFPRVEDCELLIAAGATFVVSKPFWLADLFGRLTSACRLRAS